MRTTKDLLHKELAGDLSSAIELEAQAQAICLRTQDHREGYRAFLEKRAQKVIDQAVQIHGGEGVVYGNPVEHLYREIRPLRIYEGTSEIQQLIIADELLKGEVLP